MSLLLNDEFCRSPGRFLAEHSLRLPNDLRGGEPVWLSGLGKRISDADAMPEARVAPVRSNVLRLKGYGQDPSKTRAVRCDVELDEEEYVVRFDLSGTKDSFPAYFLPFHNDRITYVELSPDAGIECFFTPIRTGHTLFVTGTPERPTIYQANAYSTLAEDEGSEPTAAGNKLREAYIEALFKLANPYEEPLLYKLARPLPAEPEPEPEPEDKRGRARAGKTSSRRRPRGPRPAPERIAVVGWISRGRWIFHYQTNSALAGEPPSVAALPDADPDA